jgi:small subunit ribosomal protein S16
VAVKIKLKRMGKIRNPQYRIIVADARTKRDGRAIEEIGKYHPKEDPSFIEVQSERAQYWLGVGAQPTEAVTAILKVTGDWQQFKGEAAPPPMKVAAPKADRKAVFEAAAKEAMDEPKPGATTPKKKAEKAEKADKAEKKADEPKAEVKTEPKAEVKAEDAPVETPVETPAPVVEAEIATEA